MYLCIDYTSSISYMYVYTGLNIHININIYVLKFPTKHTVKEYLNK